MSTYAIGDIHGCYDELMALLDFIQFDESSDALWFVGDLVNRGAASLAVLNFVKNLKSEKHVVLGNHDLHLLAVAYGEKKPKISDTLNEILTAPNRDELLNWLLRQPFLHHDETLNVVMVHAGIYPLWDLEQAKKHAKELELFFKSQEIVPFLKNMYGNHPARWDDALAGFDRYRFMVNVFTRMRYCFEDGSLELKTTCPIGEKADDLIPWFQFKNRKPSVQKIIFGHWASLQGVTDDQNIVALDTGCAWGRQLTAIRLEDMRRFSKAK
jgi:bis(5'-nucleosyl)-tetraphosphatase (symmetrical)